MVSYDWTCPECDAPQKQAVWQVVDTRERPEVLSAGTPGLGTVDCSGCGATAGIEAPLLVVRPRTALPLLLAVPVGEILDGSMAGGTALVAEMEELLRTAGTGYMSTFPRLLTELVVTRDVDADRQEPMAAARELAIAGFPWVDHYVAYLGVLGDEQPVRDAAAALDELWAADDVLAFLRAHPALGTWEALRLAQRTLADAEAGPAAEFARARIRLVGRLAIGDDPEEAAAEYAAALTEFIQATTEQFAAMYQLARSGPAEIRVESLKAALGMAEMRHLPEQIAELSYHLGMELMLNAVRRGEPTDEAIPYLARALGYLDDTDSRWAGTANNLASAYYYSGFIDFDVRWRTIDDLLAQSTRDEHRRLDPVGWAMNQTNRGLHRLERAGATADDFVEAVRFIELGLLERSPDLDPVDWAYSQVTLGLAYGRRNGPGDVEASVACLEEALRHLNPDTEHRLWLIAMGRLSQALARSEPPDLNRASDVVTEALAMIGTLAGTIHHAQLLHQAAVMAGRRDDDDSRRRLLREACDMLDPRLAPNMYMTVGSALADSYVEQRDWPDAAEVYAGLLIASDTLYRVQVSDEGRDAVLDRHPALARWAAYSLAEAGRLEEAVLALERGNARQLSLTLRRDTAGLDDLTRADPALASRYRAGLAACRLAADTATNAISRSDDMVLAAYQALGQTIDEIRQVPGHEDFMRPVTLSAIAAAANGMPIVYLVNSPDGSCALTVTTLADGLTEVRSKFVRETTSVDVLNLVLFDASGEDRPALVGAQTGGVLRRRAQIPTALRRLSELSELAAPVAEAITRSPGGAALVVPSGLLGMLPLHAIPTSAGVLDDAGMMYVAPSASAWAASRARSSTPVPRFVAIADPDGNLPGSRSEVAAIAAVLGPDCQPETATGADATTAWLLQRWTDATHLHLACHGRSTLDRAGALNLADGAALSVTEIGRVTLRRAPVIVASACQSGHYRLDRAVDEFVGIGSGFLTAGARCAITSLWQVNDHATAFLMTYLYVRLHAGNETPSEALAAARRWLRTASWRDLDTFASNHQPLSEIVRRHANELATRPDAVPYADPAAWAAFVAWGQ